VGVVLWELVAGRPLWGALPVPALVRRLIAGEIPGLREAAPAVDAELERICRRALAPRPESRYRSAAEMRGELEAYLARRGGVASDSALAALVRSACRDERRHRQRLLEARLSQLGLSAMRAPVASSPSWSEARALLARIRGARASAVGAGAAVLLLVTWLLTRAAADPSSQGDASAQRSGAATPTAPSAAKPSSEPEPLAQAARVVRLAIRVEPASAVLFLDGQRMFSNPLDAQLVLDSRPHTLRASAPGYAELVSSFQVGADLTLAAELTRHPGE
jgi:serine/threonine-protein kinase